MDQRRVGANPVTQQKPVRKTSVSQRFALLFSFPVTSFKHSSVCVDCVTLTHTFLH